MQIIIYIYIIYKSPYGTRIPCTYFNRQVCHPFCSFRYHGCLAAKMLSRFEILTPLVAPRLRFHSGLQGAFCPLGSCELSPTQLLNMFWVAKCLRPLRALGRIVGHPPSAFVNLCWAQLLGALLYPSISHMVFWSLYMPACNLKTISNLPEGIPNRSNIFI